jgi:flagellar basal-body rod protein FlgB
MDLISSVALKALDGLYARQAATAQNVANAGTENYVPVRVTFEQALHEAWTGTQAGDARQASDAIDAVQPQVVEDALAGHAVRIDEEVAEAAQTSAHYALVTGMLNRHLQFTELAIKGVTG